MIPALAATLILLRDTPDGPVVFLVKRARGMAFMPNMWVFPGGRVDAADGALPAHRRVGDTSALARLGLPDEAATSAAVAAVRETLEEAGLWLGPQPLPAGARERLGGEGFAGWLDALDMRVPLDACLPWARWVTPAGEARRFDTCFFVARAPEGDGRHDDTETVDSGWFRPQHVLDAGVAHMGLGPPTWWTLRELVAFTDVDAVLAAAATRDVSPLRPDLRLDDDGFAIVLPGHPDHAEPARAGFPIGIGLREGAWVALG